MRPSRCRGFGAVQYWTAETEQHGRCWGLRGPAGSWLTLNGWLTPNGDYNDTADSVPGCAPTRKQQVLAQGNSSTGLDPMSVDEITNSVKLPNGRWWNIYYGTVDATGATAVKDLTTGRTVRLISGQRFILVEPNVNPHCLACDNLGATNAAGKALPANYGPKQHRNH